MEGRLRRIDFAVTEWLNLGINDTREEVAGNGNSRSDRDHRDELEELFPRGEEGRRRLQSAKWVQRRSRRRRLSEFRFLPPFGSRRHGERERERGGGSRSPVALLLADHGAGGRTDSHRPRNHTSVTDLRRSRTRCSHDSRLKTTEEIGVGLSMGFLLKINLFTGPFWLENSFCFFPHIIYIT